MSEDKLAPCPFCGHIPQLIDYSDEYDYWELDCMNCPCRFISKTKEGVISQWNIRIVPEKSNSIAILQIKYRD